MRHKEFFLETMHLLEQAALPDTRLGHFGPAALRAFERMQVQERWQELILGAREARSSGEVASGASHFHENGFEKIGLYRSEQSRIQVRLHIWHNDDARSAAARCW